MKHPDQSGNCRPSPHWARFALAALVAAALAGCGGDDGATGPTGPQGPAGPAGPDGAPGQDAGMTVNAAALSPEQWATSAWTAEVTSVDMSKGTPVVTFKVADASGRSVVGLGSQAQSATATLKSYPNTAFSLAKLIPATSAAPSKWVSYIVTTVPTYKSATDKTVVDPVPRVPTTDNTGTLVDNGDGSYKYTFYRDVTKIKDQIAAMPAVTAPADKADLGDLTYDPTLAHRLTIQIAGAAPGTGSNTANAVTVTPGVNMENPLNVIYDFTPSTGKAIAAADLKRQVVAIDSCNACHEKLAIHGGGRVDTDYCVVCHTDQLKYGSANTVSASYYFNKATFKETATTNAATGITAFTYSPATNIADGAVSGDFTTLVHKIHQGKDLVKQNYNFANVAFNNKGFSKIGGGQKMCSTCHDSSKAANADNWKTAPSVLACGACHDGINFDNDTGATLADMAADLAARKPIGTTQSGHGRAGLAPSQPCSTCHEESTIAVSHQTENITPNNPAIEDGLATFTYEIASATQATSGGDVTIKFRIMKAVAPSKATTPVTFLPAASGMANPLTGFTGSPAFLLAYAMPNPDGNIPADYTNTGIKQAQAISISIASLLNTSTSATGANTTTVGSLSAQDASGYYTATIKGVSTAGSAFVCGGTATPVKCAFPAGAKMRAVGLQSYFTQVSAPASAAAGIGRHAIAVVKAVGSDTARRTVVAPAKCSNCHEWLEGHGGQRVYETQVCVMCHVPGLATSGRGIPDAAVSTWPFSAADQRILADWKFDKTAANAALAFPVTSNNLKDMIHGIHAGRDRVTPFADARDRTTYSATTNTYSGSITLLDFRRMDFPGVLNNCNTCHVTPTSATTTFNTVPATAVVSTNESIDAAYAAAIAGGTATPAIAKTALNTANDTDSASSPFASACASCHDNTAAKNHMTQNGGAIKVARSQAKVAGEACAICHGPGSQFDAAVVHK